MSPGGMEGSGVTAICFLSCSASCRNCSISPMVDGLRGGSLVSCRGHGVYVGGPPPDHVCVPRVPHQTPHGGLEPPPHIGLGLGGLHRLPCHLESRASPVPPAAPRPRGQSQASPSYLGSDFKLPALVPRRLLAPSAATPARHLPRLCCQRSWPGLAPLGGGCGGVQTGKGRANDDCQANEISWRVVAGGGGGVGGPGDREGGVQLVEGPRPSPGRVGAGVWGYSGAGRPSPPHPATSPGGRRVGCFPGQSLSRQRAEHQAPRD